MNHSSETNWLSRAWAAVTTASAAAVAIHYAAPWQGAPASSRARPNGASACAA